MYFWPGIADFCSYAGFIVIVMYYGRVNKRDVFWATVLRRMEKCSAGYYHDFSDLSLFRDLKILNI